MNRAQPVKEDALHIVRRIKISEARVAFGMEETCIPGTGRQLSLSFKLKRQANPRDFGHVT